MKYAPVQNYINGTFINSGSQRTLDVISPLDGNLLAKVPMSTAKDLDAAVQAAKAAFVSWSRTPIKERVQVFFRYKTLLERDLKQLAELAAKKMGRPSVNPSLKLKNVLNSRSSLLPYLS